MVRWWLLSVVFLGWVLACDRQDFQLFYVVDGGVVSTSGQADARVPPRSSADSDFERSREWDGAFYPLPPDYLPSADDSDTDAATDDQADGVPDDYVCRMAGHFEGSYTCEYESGFTIDGTLTFTVTQQVSRAESLSVEGVAQGFLRVAPESTDAPVPLNEVELLGNASCQGFFGGRTERVTIDDVPLLGEIQDLSSVQSSVTGVYSPERDGYEGEIVVVGPPDCKGRWTAERLPSL